MAIRCSIKINWRNLGGPVTSQVRLERWDAVEGEFVGRGAPLAELTFGDQIYIVRTKFLCFLMKHGAPEGSILSVDQLLAEVAAKGEDIPEGFAYCTLERVAGTSQ